MSDVKRFVSVKAPTLGVEVRVFYGDERTDVEASALAHRLVEVAAVREAYTVGPDGLVIAKRTASVGDVTTAEISPAKDEETEPVETPCITCGRLIVLLDDAVAAKCLVCLYRDKGPA